MFLRKLFIKCKKEKIKYIELTLQYAMKTVTCKGKEFACTSAHCLGGDSTTMSPL